VEKLWHCLGQEFVLQGHKVTHISRRYPGLENDEWDQEVHHLRVTGYPTPSSLLVLKLQDLFYTRRALKQIPEDSDVVVTNTFWAPLLLPRGLAQRAVVSVERMPKGQMRFYRRAACLRAPSSVIAEAIRSELPKQLHSKVILIPNPLTFQPPETIAWEQKVDRILYTGRVHPEKGIHLLIEALRNLPDSWPLRVVGPWQIESGGGGEAYLSQLKDVAEGLPVDFVGPIYDPLQLNEEYRQAKVFVYPSVAEQGEAFGLAPLEAMAYGAVPIVSDLACFKDFISHEHNGLVFNHRGLEAPLLLAEALKRLQGDEALSEQLAHKAIEVRQTHALSRIAELFLQDFARIIEANH
jgi:glycosyltransferase involved in cell wall biosynthesis